MLYEYFCETIVYMCLRASGLTRRDQRVVFFSSGRVCVSAKCRGAERVEAPRAPRRLAQRRVAVRHVRDGGFLFLLGGVALLRAARARGGRVLRDGGWLRLAAECPRAAGVRLAAALVLRRVLERVA